MLNVTRLDFKAGSAPDSLPLSVELGHVLVLIGPNNSGKSLSLREIQMAVQSSGREGKVINELDASFPSDFNSAFELLRPFITTEEPDREEVDRYEVRVSHIGGGGRQSTVQERQLRHAVANNDKTSLSSWLLEPYTTRLDGRTRFDLVQSQSIGDLRDLPNNHLWRLFNDAGARERVRELTNEAFGLHFVLDALNTGQVSIRLGQKPPPQELRASTISRDHQKYLDDAQPINEFGDGVQAFVGILAALHSLQHRLILLDEPEAFLHPPLIRRLGAEAAHVAEEAGGTLVVATHSPDFLLGCLGTTTKIDVVRLTYHDSVATASHLDAQRIRSLLHDPLLRSMRLASGLFHRACVVTEADRDRVFYEEMNRRLLDEERGVEDSLFLNADNWQTSARLIRPLRQVGVPGAAILDLDSIKGDETSWERILRAANIPKNQWNRVHRLRSHVVEAFDELPPDPGRKAKLKRVGVSALNGTDRRKAEELLDYLARYGVFLVPVGEVESWFSGLTIGGPKSEWLTRLFDEIGTFEDEADYRSAGSGGVWKFLENIQNWITDSERDGMQVEGA